MRTFPMGQDRLTIELIPTTAFGDNLHNRLSREDWDTLRHIQYNLAGDKCEICGATGKQQGFREALHCHEVWEYNELRRVQKLVRLIALCPLCHEVKHFGFTDSKGRGLIALRHLMAVNKCSEDEAHRMIGEAVAQWTERSKHAWELDVSWLEDHGVSVRLLPKPSAPRRSRYEKSQRPRRPRKNRRRHCLS